MINRYTAINLAVIAAGITLVILAPLAAGATVAAIGITLSLNPKIRRRDGTASAAITAAAIIMGLFMSIMAIGMSINENPNRENMLTAQRILTCFVMFSNLWILAFILRDIPIPDKPEPENPRKRESNKPAKPPFT